MNCTTCGGEIRRGEKYVSINRHVERLERKFLSVAVTVTEAEDLATYHLACEPQRG